MNKLQFIPWLIEIWFVSNVHLLLNMDCKIGLPWTFLDENIYTFPLGIYTQQSMAFLYHRIYSTLSDTFKQFSKVDGSIYSPSNNIWEFHVFYILSKTWYFQFCGGGDNHSGIGEEISNVVLIYIYLKSNDTDHLFPCLLTIYMWGIFQVFCPCFYMGVSSFSL